MGFYIWQIPLVFLPCWLRGVRHQEEINTRALCQPCRQQIKAERQIAHYSSGAGAGGDSRAVPWQLQACSHQWLTPARDLALASACLVRGCRGLTLGKQPVRTSLGSSSALFVSCHQCDTSQSSRKAACPGPSQALAGSKANRKAEDLGAVRDIKHRHSPHCLPHLACSATLS